MLGSKNIPDKNASFALGNFKHSNWITLFHRRRQEIFDILFFVRYQRHIFYYNIQNIQYEKYWRKSNVIIVEMASNGRVVITLWIRILKLSTNFWRNFPKS